MQTILRAVTDLMAKYHGVSVWIYNEVKKVQVTVWDCENNARHYFEFSKATEEKWGSQFQNLADLLQLAEYAKGGAPC